MMEFEDQDNKSDEDAKQEAEAQYEPLQITVGESEEMSFQNSAANVNSIVDMTDSADKPEMVDDSNKLSLSHGNSNQKTGVKPLITPLDSDSENHNVYGNGVDLLIGSDESEEGKQVGLDERSFDSGQFQLNRQNRANHMLGKQIVSPAAISQSSMSGFSMASLSEGG